MRRDMSKVIVERPREGSHWKTWRRNGRYDPKRILLDEDGELEVARDRFAHRRAGKSARHAKWLNENLAPLRRFLLSRAGHPWSSVWSEICQNLKPTSTVQQHVRDHVEDFVAVRTFLKDERIYFTPRHGAPRPLDDAKWLQPMAYVDPVSDVLCINPHFERYGRHLQREKAAKAAELARRFRPAADPSRRLVLLDDGNWWEVTLADCRKLASGQPRGSSEALDVIESAGLSSLTREQRYGNAALVATSKRPLSKRELRAYGLRGA